MNKLDKNLKSFLASDQNLLHMKGVKVFLCRQFCSCLLAKILAMAVALSFLLTPSPLPPPLSPYAAQAMLPPWTMNREGPVGLGEKLPGVVLRV